MTSSFSEDQNFYNWWENNLEPDTEAAQEPQKIKDSKDTEKVAGFYAKPTSHGTEDVAFAEQLGRLLFTYIQVSVASGCFHGVLVHVLNDFLVLINGCLITEIPFKEIEAIQHRAWGCPCKEIKGMPKQCKDFSRNKTLIGFRDTGNCFSPELLRGLFAR